VIGSGVIGLTTALFLRMLGHHVQIHTWREAHATTSAVAAAFWYPYRVSGYRREWAADSYDRFLSLSAEPGSGVSLVSSREWFETQEAAEGQDFWWRSLPQVGFRDCHAAELPALPGSHDGPPLVAGVAFRVPVINMPVYLRHLQRCFRRLGGTILPRRWFADLEAACLLPGDLVVNCAGFGAGRLVAAADPLEVVRPISGQVVRLIQPAVRQLTFIQTGSYEQQPLYVVPRDRGLGEVLLGGSLIELPANRDARLPLPQPCPQLSRAIRRRCERLEPALAGAPLLDTQVGLRPYRCQLRLEVDLSYSRPVIHNYGHGGAGVTLSWGTAAEVAGLVQHLASRQSQSGPCC
jgi:D-amino-acid oxidase